MVLEKSHLINSRLDYIAKKNHSIYVLLCTSQVGAEEEVGTSRYEDIRCNLNYNDLRQFVLYTSQSVYGNCDTNNNSTLLDEIMDLRTENTVSNCRSTLDAIHMNGTIQQQQQQIVQTTEENANTKMSLLLKKMLQAPVGANLGEIASPVSSTYLLLTV